MVWAGGRDHHAQQVLVEVETDTGLLGVGEAMGALSTPVIEAVLREFATSLVGQAPDDFASLDRLWFGSGRWRFFRPLANYARCALEMALWDIQGQALGVPIHALLGGRVRDSIDHYCWIHRDGEDPIAQARRGRAAGFNVFYVKVGIENERDEEIIELVAGIREVVGRDRTLRIDANQAWTPYQAVRILRALEDCALDWVEEPIIGTDPSGLQYVRNATGTALAVDQGAWLQHEIVSLVAQGAVDVVCTDPSRVGGLLSYVRLAAALDEMGARVCRHTGNEFGVFLAASLQASATVPNLTSGNQHCDLLAWDIIREQLGGPAGSFPVSTQPGLGITLDRDRVGQAYDNHQALHMHDESRALP